MKGIAQKLWAGMMLLVVVMLVLLWFFQIVFLEDFYIKGRVGEVKTKAKAFMRVIDELDDEGLREGLDSFVYDYNCSIEFTDQRGNVIYSSEANRPMSMMRYNHQRGGLLREVLSGRDINVSTTHPRSGSSYSIIGMPVEKGDEITGALMINMPLAPVQDTAAILKKQLIYISLILLSASLGLSFLLSKSFIRPILEIKAATGRMASGDFDVRLNVTSKDEIGALSNAINHLGSELAKTEQLRKDLIANVSHELRTPLSLIRGYAETIRDITGDNIDKRDRQLGIIIEESNRLSNIVNDILIFSRLQSGNVTLEKTSFDIIKTLQSIIKKYSLISDKTDVDIILKGILGDAVGEELFVWADEARIEQVLFNLINNAFNYSTPGNYITVSAESKGDVARIEVSDIGKGIPPEDLENIWDRYYKGSKRSKKRIFGTGLGLAIVKNILEEHEAKYGVESAKGNGTTFWFEIDATDLKKLPRD